MFFFKSSTIIVHKYIMTLKYETIFTVWQEVKIDVAFT